MAEIAVCCECGMLDLDDCHGEAGLYPFDVGMEKARPAYRDAGRPERPCVHCGERFRGPSIYCSPECHWEGFVAKR